jgi:phage-related tail fiber protein
LSGTQTIDAVGVVADDRVLVKSQSDASENGIYVVAAGAWSRAADADTADEITSALVFVREGTANENTSWYMETDSVVLDTTNLVWTQFGAGGGSTYTAGAGLTLAGGEFSIASGDITDAMLESIFTKKATTTIGDNSTTSFAFTHNLDTDTFVWSVRDTGTDEMVLMTPTINTADQATFAFATAPTTGQYEITVIG